MLCTVFVAVDLGGSQCWLLWVRATSQHASHLQYIGIYIIYIYICIHYRNDIYTAYIHIFEHLTEWVQHEVEMTMCSIHCKLIDDVMPGTEPMLSPQVLGANKQHIEADDCTISYPAHKIVVIL